MMPSTPKSMVVNTFDGSILMALNAIAFGSVEAAPTGSGCGKGATISAGSGKATGATLGRSLTQSSSDSSVYAIDVIPPGSWNASRLGPAARLFTGGNVGVSP